MGDRCRFCRLRGRARNGIHITGVLVVMAVQTQVFPVAAICGVVVVVVVLVMNGQFMQIFAGKFAPTAPADPRMEF